MSFFGNFFQYILDLPTFEGVDSDGEHSLSEEDGKEIDYPASPMPKSKAGIDSEVELKKKLAAASDELNKAKKEKEQAIEQERINLKKQVSIVKSTLEKELKDKVWQIF